MKVFSAFLLTLMLLLSGCGGSSGESASASGDDSNADTSEYLRVSLPSGASTSSVDIEKYVALTFSYTLDETTVNASSVHIMDENNVSIAAILSVSGENISIIPNAFFLPNMQYTIVVTSDVEDSLGRTLENTFKYTFTTESLPATDLRVVGVSYSGKTIRIEFSEDLNTSTVTENDFAINEGSITFDHLLILDDYTVKFIADSVLSGDEIISVSGMIEDIYGNYHNDGIDAIYTFVN